MTLRIERREEEQSTILLLIGELRAEETKQVTLEISRCISDVTLDLKELNIVDLVAVRFLLACKSRGMKLCNCPRYVREWIKQETEKE